MPIPHFNIFSFLTLLPGRKLRVMIRVRTSNILELFKGYGQVKNQVDPYRSYCVYTLKLPTS